jgi:hypothetical protein
MISRWEYGISGLCIAVVHRTFFSGRIFWSPEFTTGSLFRLGNLRAEAREKKGGSNSRDQTPMLELDEAMNGQVL